MAFIDPAVAEGMRFVVRQVTNVVTSAAATTLTGTEAPGPTTAASTTLPATTSSTGSPTDTGTFVNGPSATPSPGGNNNNNNGNGGGQSSSPLLFFVALGFGVVFTNLWIIVGVKYCFRYNARSRQMRAEDGEPINMENMPRPHRRRREKKLMTMDEVNEKFPMVKYKSWVASRAQEGLPTRGGVSAPPSRANSIRDADGVAPELPSKERMSTEDRPTTSAVTDKQVPSHIPKESTSSTVHAPPRPSTDANLVPTVSESATLSKDPNRASHDEEEEDDEHINAALPPECMGTSGDTCAICIDTLEDDDDVRGLTCGHAFHAACLDPWLTSRRACCPLCKADYYTPKPRPPAAEAAEAAAPGGTTPILIAERTGRMNLPGRPRRAFFTLGRGSRPVITHTFTNPPVSSPQHQPAEQTGWFDRFRRGNASGGTPASPSSAPTTSPTRSTQPQTESDGILAGFRAAFPAAFRSPRPSRRRTDRAVVASGALPTVTPSNLEAGVRAA